VGTITGITYTASSNYAAYTGLTAEAKMRDGDYISDNSIHGTQNEFNPYIKADLGSTKNVTKINIAPITSTHPDGWGPDYINDIDIEYSTDDSSWTYIITASGHADNVTKTYDVDIDARYIRLYYAGTYYIAVGDFWFEDTPSGSSTPVFFNHLRTQGMA